MLDLGEILLWGKSELRLSQKDDIPVLKSYFSCLGIININYYVFLWSAYCGIVRSVHRRERVDMPSAETETRCLNSSFATNKIEHSAAPAQKLRKWVWHVLETETGCSDAFCPKWNRVLNAVRVNWSRMFKCIRCTLWKYIQMHPAFSWGGAQSHIYAANGSLNVAGINSIPQNCMSMRLTLKDNRWVTWAFLFSQIHTGHS